MQALRIVAASFWCILAIGVAHCAADSDRLAAWQDCAFHEAARRVIRSTEPPDMLASEALQACTDQEKAALEEVGQVAGVATAVRRIAELKQISREKLADWVRRMRAARSGR